MDSRVAEISTTLSLRSSARSLATRWRWACAVALAMLPATALAQTSGTWTNTAGGAWGTGTNWAGGFIADGTGAVADFSTLEITGVKTITLDAPRTSGTLLFGDTAGANGGWTLTSSTLTLATASGAPTISVTGLGNAPTSNSVTISSVIAGTSGFAKSGTSMLVLSAANTYSGTTTLNSNGGYLVLNNASALGSSSSVVVNTTSAVAIGNGITIGAGKSINIGSSSGVNSEGALTAISGGTGTWAGNVTTGGGRLGYTGGSNLVVTGTIGGSSNLVISGYSPSDGANTQTLAYAVTITTPATYTGQTQLLRGNLRLGVDNALPTGTTLDIHNNAGGSVNQTSTVDLNGFSQTVGALQSSGVLGGYGNAYLTNSGSTTKTFTVNQATNTTFYGIIQGNLSFTKSGAGNLTLTPTWLTGSGTNWVTGTSTFSGDTLVSAGTLTLGNANALFGSTFDTASTGTLSLGTLTAATFGGLKNSGTFTLTNSGSAFALSVGGNNASSTFAGTLNGLGGLTKVGSGTFTVTGSSGYAGVTTLAGGAFALGGANAVPASGTITFSGGALQYTASNTDDYTARIANSGSAVAIDTNGQSVTFTGGIDATNTGGLKKLGSGTLTLSGSSGYSGATTVASGVLALGNANSLPASGTVTFTGGTLQYSASNTANLASRIASSTAAIAIDTNGQSVTWAGNLASTNTGGLTKTGSGLLTLSGSNAFTGAVAVTGGTLAVSGSYAFPTGVTGVSLNGGVLQAAGPVTLNMPGGIPAGATISLGASGGTLASGLPGGAQWYINAPITGGVGTGALSVSGTGGEFVLTGSSSYTGGTILSAAQVAIGSDAAFGKGTITFAGGGLRATSAAARTLSNAVTISAGASFYGANKDLILSGPITLSGSTQTVAVTGTGINNVFAGSVGDGGAGLGLTKAGAGTLTLSGSNTYSGATSVTAGSLQFGDVSAFAGTSGISVAGGASLAYTGGAASLARSITVTGGTGTVRNAGSGQLTLAGTLTKNGTVLRLTGGAFNVTGQIVGANANSDLLVDGTSTVTLSNTNTYNGPTFVNQSSTLVVGVSNAIPSNSTVTLGDATSRGAVDLGSNTDSIAGLVFSGSGGTLRMAANQTASPQLATTGSLGLGANASLDLTGMGTTAGRYQLVSYTASSGSFGGVTGLASGYQLVYGATRLDAQQKAVVGTVTVTSPTAAIITGGSAAFTYTVANAAAADGADLVFASSAGANLAGLSSGTVAAGSTSGPISGLSFNGTAIGLAQTGTFTVADPDSYGGSQTGVVTATVLDHATPGFVGIDAALTNLVLDFGTVDQSAGLQSIGYSLTNIASVYGDSLTASLALTGFSHLSGDTLFDSGLATFASLLAGGTNGYTASFTPTSQGTFSEVFKLTFSDQQNLSGAAQRRDLTLTMNVVVVPEPGALVLAGIGVALVGWALRGRRKR